MRRRLDRARFTGREFVDAAAVSAVGLDVTSHGLEGTHMKFRTLSVLLFVVVTSAWAAAASASGLYVGTQPGCNEGIVTTDPNLMGCSTAPYGSPGPQRYSTIALFSGLTPGVNAGLVSTYPDFLGGTTRFIGYAVLNGDPTKRLYGGAVEGCNKGYISNDPNFRGCATSFIGYANY
jgi:hypothetical protein